MSRLPPFDPHKIDGRHFVLDDTNNLVSVSMLEWAQWLTDHAERRIVRQTDLEHVHVSTVFLGLDHNYWGKGPPICFETMVFAQEFHTSKLGDDEFQVREDLGQWRHATYDDALAGHMAICKRFQKMEDEAAAQAVRVSNGKDAKA